MQETSPPNDSGLSISGFRYNHKAFNDALEFKRIHDPAFKDIKSLSAFAEKFGISESTVKRLFSGKANDFMTSLLWYSCRILGLDPAVVLYLAPSRDYEREAREYNPTLMDNLRRQIAALEERIVSKKEKIDELNAEIAKRDAYEKDLRERLLTVSGDLSKEQQKNAAAPTVAAELQQVKKHKHALAVCLIISSALTITFAGIMIYFLWELQNPQAGNWQF